MIDRFKENVRLGSSQTEECEFLVIDGDMKYDIIIGYDFLKRNKIIVHLESMMLGKKVEDKGVLEYYLDD